MAVGGPGKGLKSKASKSSEDNGKGDCDMEDNKDMYRPLLRETVLGYAFWSLFHGLGPMIWFYPLNELEISGYEAFCLIWLCPILTGIGPIFKIIQSRWGLCALRWIVLASLGSFQAPSTLTRLGILSFGNGAAMLVLTATLWSDSAYQRCVTYWGLILGYFAMLVSRVFFMSFCPTWWDALTNSIVLGIVTIATLDKFISGDDIPLTLSKPQPLSSLSRPNWVFTALAFGSLMFLTHWLYGEVSVMLRWTVSGYPSTGPMPYPWGFVVLIALMIGTFLSPHRFIARNPVSWLVGTGASLVLYCRFNDDPWLAFTGGLVLAMYVMLVWPEIIDRLTMCPCARTLFLGTLFYIIEILFSVWTTAYNFVPGGEYTREHSDYLLAFIMVTIGLGIFTSKQNPKEKSRTAFQRMGEGPCVKALLIILLLLGGIGFGTRYKNNNFDIPKKSDPKEFRAAIWTFHFGYDNRGWPSMERAAQFLNNTGADVITLLESDASKPFLGNNDLGMWLGERLGMYVDFGPATKDHTWGNLLLSKYPIVKSKHHLLPSPYGELAPAITATVNFSGNMVDFVVTHMGNDRDVYDRELQAKVLSDELKSCEHPAVFLGYITSAPGSRDYLQLINHGGVKDIDETDKERWCEYIMYKKLTRIGYARVSHAGLSDTELQMATFRIPSDPNDFKDNDKSTKDSSKIEKRLHFSKRFGDYQVGHNWFPEHRFHMSTPKYFIPA